MKCLLITGYLVACALGSPGAPPPGPEQKPSPAASTAVSVSRAWLGLKVFKPDETITAQLPSLPPGIGFVIQSVEKGGPAELAGLRRFDVLWKLGDQMLVNEGQFAALLRLFKPGDEVVLTGFRGGQSLKAKAILADTPQGKHPFPGALLDAAILPGECEGPMRVIKLSEKLATYSAAEGRARVWRDALTYKVRIQDLNDQVIYEGELPADGNLDEIPQNWRRRVHALRRGLRHALEGQMRPSRQPRPRVVPPAKRKS